MTATVNVPALLAGLKLVNYYPMQHSWSNMWTQWDASAIDADFGRIAALHGNAVRLIIQANTFGYPTPAPAMLAHLSQAVGLAANHGLRVQLTLFDWWSSYIDVTGSQQWARAVLAPYAGDMRIAFVELQNEINPTNQAAISWARQMVPYVRSLVGGIPVTLSVSGSGGLTALQALAHAVPLDFYDVHYYGDPALAYTVLRQAQQIVAPAPLYIGETGLSSRRDATDPNGCTTMACGEAQQDLFYRSVQYAAGRLGLPPVAPWTLTDFAPGSLANQPANSTEYNFGLYRVDGTAKPVAASVSAFFGAGTVDTSFNNGFESAAGTLPAGWNVYHALEGHFALDTTVAHTGQSSARISNSTGDNLGVPAFFVSPVNASVSPGQVYTASVWARGQNATGGTRIAIAWFDASGNYLGQVESRWLPTGTTQWTQLTASGPAPANAAYVQIHLKSSFNTGTAWFDDVSFH